MPQPSADVLLLQRTFARERAAGCTLVRRLTPVILSRSIRELRKRTPLALARIRLEAEDMTQDTLTLLFEQDMKVLRQWSPKRECSLEGYVSMIAGQQVLARLRTKKRHPCQEEPASREEAREPAHGATPEQSLIAREALQRAAERIKMRFSSYGIRMFECLYIDQEPLEHVVATTGQTRDSIYQWRSRIRKELLEADVEA